MTEKEKRRFTVLSNSDINVIEPEYNIERTRNEQYNAEFSENNYQTNPIYEKLLNFQKIQKKKRFTVDDLLKW